jgi:hypothetical protein
MTDESLRIAAGLMKAAYQSGYEGKQYTPPTDHGPDAAFSLELHHALGKGHAQRGQKSDYWTPYGVGSCSST